MKRILILAAAAAAASLSACGGGDDGPLAAAHAGKFLCITPDVHDKTCQITGVYSWDLFGHITSRFDMGLTDANKSVSVFAEMKAPVTIENGLVCSTITADTIKHMTLKWNNQEIPHDIEEKARQQALTAMSGMMGKKGCTSFTPVGDYVQLTSMIDGAPAPNGNQYALWSGKDDGYVLVPTALPQ